MNIFLAQQNYHIGNFEYNTAKIIAAIGRAKAQGADLVLFSELAICGYPPRDFLEFNDFIRQCYESVDAIKAHTHGIAVLVGGPARNPRKEGKDLFNAAFFLYEGEIKAEVHKTLLPTYDVFDENRYFEPAYDWNVIVFKGKKLAVTICEDIWNLGDNPLYRQSPLEVLKDQNPDLILNLSASPYNYAQDVVRRSIVEATVAKYGIPMVYCNTVGSQTEIVFDGGSLVYDINGYMVKELAYFSEDEALVNLADLYNRKQAPDVAHKYYYSASEVGLELPTLEYLNNEKNISEIYAALVLGIRDYFGKMGFKKATLGASGGIDSAVVQALAVAALGKENIHVLLMPSEFSTGHSISDAVQLSQNLGNRYDIVPIREIYDQFIVTLKPLFGNLPFSLAEENIQSRSRGNLLMAVANKFGYILLNTSNKSELSTGYGTLYGDMAGGLSVLGDLYKTQVYALARYINRGGEIIPENILTKAPSAELRPGQKDSDSLPEYDVLDQVLYQYIELRQGPRDIIAAGFDEALVTRTLRMVNANEYKRAQFCPIIRVSSKAFGVGRRLPIVAKYLG